VYAVIEGQRLMLHQDWPLLLIGIFALHVWAPEILHTAIDSFKLFVIPATGATTISYLPTIASIGIPLLVFAIPRRVLIGGRGGER
jgi:hypothetical protein